MTQRSKKNFRCKYLRENEAIFENAKTCLIGGKFTENIMGSKNFEMRRGYGAMVAHQTSGAEVLGSNPASPTTIRMRCRIIVQ